MSDGRVVRADELRDGDAVVENGGIVRVYGIDLVGDEVHIYVDHARCAGTNREAVSWAFLHRKEALHAVYKHYAYPNLSICRFRSESRGDYAADLVFEIDAHDTVPTGCPITFFEPYIRAAVEVGRHVLYFLTGPLAIDPKYITTAISRMGARVTVDWRAFGPRRLFEILAVVKYIEHAVCGAEGLVELARLHNVPKLVIDTGPYERNDAPKPSEEVGNAFIGPWLRPLGGVHTKSSNAGWWYRTIAVRHARFHPDNAAQLVAMSRAKGAPPVLRDAHVFASESRLPSLDHYIEDDPRPALKLIDLFEDEALAEKLQPDAKALVEKFSRSGARPRRPAGGSGEQRDLNDADLRRVLTALGADYADKGERYVFDCVVPSCKKGGQKASVHKESGVYWCWRDGCRQGVHLTTLAAELGLSHLLPPTTHSSEPLQWIRRSELPQSTSASWNRPLVTVLSPECEDLEEVRAHRTRLYESWPQDDYARVLVDVSDTGLGKSHAALALLRQLGVRYRIFGPRDDLKRDYAEALPDAVLIEGRRPGVNCTNDALAEVLDRVEPVGETLCAVCPQRRGCLYLAQLERATDSDLILGHGHGPFAAIKALNNGSEIDVVDEDALDAVIETIDLNADELDLFRVVVEREFQFGPGDGDIGLDVEGELQPRRAASARIEVLLARLGALLTTDAVVTRDPQAARDGRIADLALARVLFHDPALRKVVGELRDDDLEAHEEARLGLVHGWHSMLGPMGYSLSPEHEVAWLASPERQQASAAEDPVLEELAAFATWSTASVRPVPWPEALKVMFARPKAIFRPLVEALQHLLGVYERGEDEPTRLLAFRPKKSGPWVLRLARRRPFLPDARKVLYLSATATPTRTELLLGPPSPGSRWVVFAPRLRRHDRRTIIADRSYTKTAILRDDKLRLRLFETATTLIKSEAARTTMPVALMGPTAIITDYLKSVIGDRADTFKLNASLSKQKREDLRTLTTAHGFVVGWAYGVAGSNDFAIEQDGVRRFLRSAIVLGNCVPNLRDFADHHRGLLAGYWRLVEDDDNDLGPRVVGEPVLPDWTMTYRAVPFEGQVRGDEQLVASNMIGFGDPVATEILDGRYLAEFLQMVGRIRPHIPDPVDPTIEPRSYIIAGVAIPGYEVDHVLGLEELRAELGLPAEPKGTRGRPSKKTPEQALRDVVKERGPAKTVIALVRQALKTGMNPESVTTWVRLMFENAELKFGGALVAATNQVIVERLKAAGRDADADRIALMCGTVRQTA